MQFLNRTSSGVYVCIQPRDQGGGRSPMMLIKADTHQSLSGVPKLPNLLNQLPETEVGGAAES